MGATGPAERHPIPASPAPSPGASHPAATVPEPDHAVAHADDAEPELDDAKPEPHDAEPEPHDAEPGADADDHGHTDHQPYTVSKRDGDADGAPGAILKHHPHCHIGGGRPGWTWLITIGGDGAVWIWASTGTPASL